MQNPPDRPLEIASFLDQHGWGEAVPHPFAADFSPRRYARLVQETGATAILMDADGGQKTQEFLIVGNILRQTGLRAPAIYAADANRGLVLMEDFGTRNVGALIDAHADPRAYCLRATEALAQLHNAGPALPESLPVFDTNLFTHQAGLFLEDYVPLILGRETTPEETAEFAAAWRTVLRPLENLPQRLLLRDFMPDNWMELPSGELGFLDFQDAGLGPIAYDLASMGEEVRRDGGFALLEDILAAYRRKSCLDIGEEALKRGCLVLSAQRHMRILGILARLGLRQGRREKLALLPRVKAHLTKLLKEPCLMPVSVWAQSLGEEGI